MTTNSFPAVGTGGLTDSQWSTMYGSRDGIIEDYVGNALSLSRLNTTNICQVAPGKMAINGYTLDVTAAHDLYCAPVVTGQPAVTYYIVGMYDPALNVADGGGARSATGPCQLLITTGNPDTSGGKVYVLLYKLIRTANQLLAAAALTEYRRWIGPVVSQPDYPSDAPTGFGPFPRGTMMIQTDTDGVLGSVTISVRTVNDAGSALLWQSLTRPPGVEFESHQALVALDAPAEVVLEGSWVNLRGTLRRSSGTNLATGATVVLGTLPVGLRPGRTRRFSCLASPNNYAGVYVALDGEVGMYDPPGTPTVDYISLDNIRFRVGD